MLHAHATQHSKHLVRLAPPAAHIQSHIDVLSMASVLTRWILANGGGNRIAAVQAASLGGASADQAKFAAIAANAAAAAGVAPPPEEARGSAEITRDHPEITPRSPEGTLEGTRGYPRVPESTELWLRLPEIARDCPRLTFRRGTRSSCGCGLLTMRSTRGCARREP